MSTQQPHQQPLPPQQPAARRRLTRSRTDAKVSGVCGGVAAHLGLDPTLVRVLAAVAVLVTFPAGLVVYLVLWAVVPKE